MLDAQRQHEAWLATAVEEEVLEPSLPIIDPHHHLWYRSKRWPHAANYMLEEMASDIEASGHNVLGTVYVQSSSAGWRRASGPEEERVLGETEVMQGIAAMAETGLYSGSARVCAGIVGTADLLLGGAVEPVLRGHMAIARNFRGVRFLGGKAEQIPFRDPRFREGVSVLERLGLVLDCNGPETHPLDFAGVLGGLADLATQFPDLTVVLDHCGGAVGPHSFGAEAVGGKREEWESAMSRLAKCPRVYVKVGGLHMPANGFPLDSESRTVPIGSEDLAQMMLPYYRFVIETFGAQRCMFESNFPVDRWGTTYRVLWNALKRAAGLLGLSDAEKAAVFRGTAAEVYRL